MRIIYNTSFIIDEAIEQEWVAFMRQHYISQLRNHNLCDDVIFTKVSIDQPECKTYSIQIVFANNEQQDYFLNNHLPEIEQKIIAQYANRYVCFSSVLTEI